MVAVVHSRESTNSATRLLCTCTQQERIQEANPKTIILSGGPNSVHVEGAPRVRRSLGIDQRQWAATSALQLQL